MHRLQEGWWAHVDNAASCIFGGHKHLPVLITTWSGTGTTNRPREWSGDLMICPGLGEFPDQLLPLHCFSGPKFSCSIFQWLVRRHTEVLWLMLLKDQDKQKLHRCFDGCFRVSSPTSCFLGFVCCVVSHAQVFCKDICQPKAMRVKIWHVLLQVFLNHSSLLPPSQSSTTFCCPACPCCPNTHASQFAN